jgi:hypothetical protein
MPIFFLLALLKLIMFNNRNDGKQFNQKIT